MQNNHKKISIFEYYQMEEGELDTENLYNQHSFTFDHVYDQSSTQEEVYANTARQAVLSGLQGYNASLLAYGQTGTGKTYTMEGFKYNQLDPQRGIIPRTISEIFNYIENSSKKQSTFMVRASYLQIYNETISDLLSFEKSSLQIREDAKKGVYVEGLSEWAVRTPNEIFSLLKKGSHSRMTA